jgi:hypothetical protein
MAEIHPGALDTYKYLSRWIDGKFPFSYPDGWGRMGFLGVFAHYVLSHLRGDILEIGAGESSVYLNQVAKIFGCRIFHCDIQGGVLTNALSVPGYFCDDNILIWPTDEVSQAHQCVLFAGPSDKFFERIKFTPIAFAYIDGDHTYEQARKDFYNVVPLVMDNGFIVLHDTYPHREEYTAENVCGGVYKLRQEIERNRKDFDAITLVEGTAISHGFTIVRKKPKDLPYFNE